MAGKLDWNHIRKHAFSDSNPPADWPAGIQPISLEGAGLFGLDEQHRLYWDGKRVEVRRGLTLTFWQKLGAVVGIVSAAMVAIVAVAEFSIRHL